MLSVKELRGLAAHMTGAQLEAQLGPFVLVQQPPQLGGPGTTPHMGLPANVQRTMVASAARVSEGALALLFQFDDLVVASLPPLEGVATLTVGRLPDCDLVLDDPSVSKQHAVLRWDSAAQRCTVEDVGSTNGTFLNASVRVKRELELKSGDILSFGEVQYWFLLTPMLLKKLTAAPARSISV